MLWAASGCWKMVEINGRCLAETSLSGCVNAARWLAAAALLLVMELRLLLCLLLLAAAALRGRGERPLW